MQSYVLELLTEGAARRDQAGVLAEIRRLARGLPQIEEDSILADIEAGRK
jgi:hypothetical protein